MCLRNANNLKYFRDSGNLIFYFSIFISESTECEINLNIVTSTFKKYFPAWSTCDELIFNIGIFRRI